MKVCNSFSPLYSKIYSIKYSGAMGYMVYMDENGDAEGNYTLIARKKRDKHYGLYPVGVFGLPVKSTQLPVV